MNGYPSPVMQVQCRHGIIKLVAPGPELGARLRGAVAGRPVYVHLDCDVLEPGLVPSEYQVAGGLSLADLHDACTVLAEHELIGLEVAEFEAEWPDGSPGNEMLLVNALTPLLVGAPQ